MKLKKFFKTFFKTIFFCGNYEFLPTVAVFWYYVYSSYRETISYFELPYHFDESISVITLGSLYSRNIYKVFFIFVINLAMVYIWQFGRKEKRKNIESRR